MIQFIHVTVLDFVKKKMIAIQIPFRLNAFHCVLQPLWFLKCAFEALAECTLTMSLQVFGLPPSEAHKQFLQIYLCDRQQGVEHFELVLRLQVLEL